MPTDTPDADPLDEEVRAEGLQQLWIAAALLFQAGHAEASTTLPTTPERRAAVNRQLLYYARQAVSLLEAGEVLAELRARSLMDVIQE
jgi:hypothetical protein